MKTVILIFSAILLLSCATTKKTSVSADANTTATVVTDKSTVSNINTLIDTTKFTDAEISYTKVEFYEPVTDTASPPQKNENAPDDIVVSVEKPPNVGAVKSVENLTIKYSNEEKGTAQSNINVVDSLHSQIDYKESQKLNSATEQKAKYWLKYIMWIAICATIITAIIYAYKFISKFKK
ncbi:MAG: hypothetical protein LBP85_02470 [Prevotellaceae bacterium]|nr:hypothetical protein [Prevotellaceae bacterium]